MPAVSPFSGQLASSSGMAADVLNEHGDFPSLTSKSFRVVAGWGTDGLSYAPFISLHPRRYLLRV